MTYEASQHLEAHMMAPECTNGAAPCPLRAPAKHQVTDLAGGDLIEVSVQSAMTAVGRAG